ncbi:MAG: virulence-associated protein [Microvirga sp.]|nr:virulence-associated protein [Microvirga sp.]
MRRMDSADLARIVAGIRDRFPLSGVAAKAGVKLHRVGREWKACCPFHPDNTPSFTIFADDRRAHCFGCGWSGDVLDFVQQAYGVKLPAAIDLLDGGALRALEQQRAPGRPKADMRPLAQRIVNSSVPVEGTPAAIYLRSRGITMDPPHTLRFARLAPPRIEGNGLLAANGPDPLPTLIAIVTDPAGALVGLQRTYLTEDGRKAATRVTETDRSFACRMGARLSRLEPAAAGAVVCDYRRAPADL